MLVLHSTFKKCLIHQDSRAGSSVGRGICCQSRPSGFDPQAHTGGNQLQDVLSDHHTQTTAQAQEHPSFKQASEWKIWILTACEIIISQELGTVTYAHSPSCSGG